MVELLKAFVDTERYGTNGWTGSQKIAGNGVHDRLRGKEKNTYLQWTRKKKTQGGSALRKGKSIGSQCAIKKVKRESSCQDLTSML